MTEQDWFDGLSDALQARLGADEPSLRLPRERNPILLLARDVAHGTERRNAPLATYLAGRYVAARMAGGADERTALDEVRETVAALLPPEQPQ